MKLVPVALLAIAAIFGLFATISLPSVEVFDVVRVSFTSSGTPLGSTRWGIWGYCYDNTGSNHFNCEHLGLGYNIWGYDVNTRRLVVHVVAFACTVVALGFAFSEAALLVVLASFLAALLSLVSMAMDIVLYVHVRSQSDSGPFIQVHTEFGGAFWMTLIATLACLGAGVIIYFDRNKGANTNSYPRAGALAPSV